MIGIYKITSPSGKIYIGQSVNIKNRWKNHKTKCHKGKLKNSFIKYGTKNHVFEIIELCDVSELNDKERYYQDLYDSVNNGLNLRATTSFDKSGFLSNETILKMKGKKCSEEHIRRSSESRKGMKHSEEHKLKISLAGTGRKHTQESILKISLSKTGLKISDEAKIKIGLHSSIRNSGGGNPKAKKVINILTNEIFDTIKDAAKSINMCHKKLGTILRKEKNNFTSIVYYDK